jgi:hypothetical protein
MNSDKYINLSWIPKYVINFNRSHKDIIEFKEELDDNYCYIDIYFCSGNKLTFYIDKNEQVVSIKKWIL